MSSNSELRTIGLGFCWQDYTVGDRFQTIGRSISEADLVSFINTTGIGFLPDDVQMGVAHVRPGDLVLVNGTLGDHGIAVMSRREGLDLAVELESDVAPLNGLIDAVRLVAPNVRFMRDVTRGGLAAVANEVVLRQAFGLRVFDVSNPRKPKYVAAVETDCGSHTHTLAPTKNGKSLFVYVSSYSPNADYPDCQPPHDKISVVKIPVKKPARAKLAATPVLFPDGGNPGGPIPLLTNPL